MNIFKIYNIYSDDYHYYQSTIKCSLDTMQQLFQKTYKETEHKVIKLGCGFDEIGQDLFEESLENNYGITRVYPKEIILED